jgi:heavy metal sensor kinase
VTLTNRLSLFFLAALALVLAGFSAALYLLARAHLHHEAADRLEAALATLTAAVEDGPAGLEWEPAERRLDLAARRSGAQLVWLVSDGRGQVVDRSVPPEDADFLTEAAAHLRAEHRPARRLDWQGGRWQFRQQWLEAAQGKAGSHPSRNDPNPRYPALVVTVATSLEPARATLRTLAMALTGLSVGIWLAALFLGRLLCRRALLPVQRMAACARAMDTADLGQRLPAAATGDELEDLGRAFNSLLDRLQESFERQRRFTGDASHQLRTPLAAMLGQVEVALRRERPADEYRRALACVQEQAGRMRRIVEALLFLARADGEAPLPGRERLDLAGWLPAHVRSWADHPRAADIIVAAGETGAARVEVHPVLLGELVNILVDNACKHSPPGRPVTLRLQHRGEMVELSVQDEGCGIAEVDLPHVFEPFFRSGEARRSGVEGLGLGLAIARRLADAFGGTLTAASHPGQGSCFTLRLPAATARQATPEAGGTP